MSSKNELKGIELLQFESPLQAIQHLTTTKTDEDSFFIVDLEDVRRKHLNWLQKLPRVRPFYAVKCNPEPVILKLLAQLGAGFDCASKTEIETVLGLQVPPDRIIFAHPCKRPQHVDYAKQVAVQRMTFDNANELHKIKERYAEAKCVLRIVTNDSEAVWKLSSKFGADMDESKRLIRLAGELGLTLEGVAFHVGSNQMSAQAFREAIENARILFDYAWQEFGIRLSLLDIGGGYPGASDSKSIELFEQTAQGINEALEDFFPSDYVSQIRNFEIISEPGTYYVCSALTLATCVIAKREVATASNENKNSTNNQTFMYYLNDGTYTSFMPLMLERLLDPNKHMIPQLVEKRAGEEKKREGELFSSTIWGPTCDGVDWIARDVMLPEFFEGEFFAFGDMGAYNQAMSTLFNGMPLPRSFYVANESWWDTMVELD